MKKYLNPTLEVLELGETDVITTSKPQINNPNETPGVAIFF